MRAIGIVILFMMLSLYAAARNPFTPLVDKFLEASELDSVQIAEAAAKPPLKGNWVQQLMANNFHINDPRVHYPKFINFCRLVYNWGDHTFNTYDKEYVVGTGKNWKFYGKSYNWAQSYAYIFNLFQGEQVRLQSNINSDAGLTLNFMAVSTGYTWNLNQIFSGNRDHRKTFNFSFTCALFSAELTSWSTKGNTHITKFGDFKINDRRPHIPFQDIDQSALNFNIYYFFNHKRYSQGAAYCYSKYQRKSAGSWILGFNFNKQNISMDFGNLPSDMRDALPQLADRYNFQYKDYEVLGGYGYNAVMPHNWLFNITILPSVGYKRSILTEVDENGHGYKNMLSLNTQAKAGVVYNHRAFFAAAVIRFDGGWFLANDYSFFNSMESASALIGIRF